MYSLNFGPKPSASRCSLDTGVEIDSKDAVDEVIGYSTQTAMQTSSVGPQGELQMGFGLLPPLSFWVAS